MTDAANPQLVLTGAVLNLLAGALNVLVGLAYLFVCYGIVVVPIGLWQMLCGAMGLTGNRVPGHLWAAVLGLVGSAITFNVMGFVLSLIAVGLLGFERTLARR
jgi:hypothetical protein